MRLIPKSQNLNKNLSKCKILRWTLSFGGRRLEKMCQGHGRAGIGKYWIHRPIRTLKTRKNLAGFDLPFLPDPQVRKDSSPCRYDAAK
jgi:hypothetical protein